MDDLAAVIRSLWADVPETGELILQLCDALEAAQAEVAATVIRWTGQVVKVEAERDRLARQVTDADYLLRLLHDEAVALPAECDAGDLGDWARERQIQIHQWLEGVSVARTAGHVTAQADDGVRGPTLSYPEADATPSEDQ